MAIVTNAYSTFTAVGNREDLADIIYDISPMDTPFFSRAPKTSATHKTHEWQTDSLAAAADNAALEGDTATAVAVTASTKVSNFTQIFEKAVTVSGTQRSVNSAGRADEYSYQTMKQGRELKRDIEHGLTRNYAGTAGGIGTARHLGSLESWLSTNRTTVGVSTSGVATAGWSTSGIIAPVDASTAGSFTKASLDAVIEACWTSGGNPTVILCGPHNRTQLSGFTGISTLFTDAQKTDQTYLQGAVDFYKSNFGTLEVVPSRFSRDATVSVLDMDYFAVAELRPMQLTPMAKTGDADTAQILCELTLEVRNEAASGKVTDCTT